MNMYKDGITRTVEEMDIQRFKDEGWIELKPVKEEQPKQENIDVIGKKTVRKKNG